MVRSYNSRVLSFHINPAFHLCVRNPLLLEKKKSQLLKNRNYLKIAMSRDDINRHVEMLDTCTILIRNPRNDPYSDEQLHAFADASEYKNVLVDDGWRFTTFYKKETSETCDICKKSDLETWQLGDNNVQVKTWDCELCGDWFCKDCIKGEDEIICKLCVYCEECGNPSSWKECARSSSGLCLDCCPNPSPAKPLGTKTRKRSRDGSEEDNDEGGSPARRAKVGSSSE